jgi:3-oxoacyl-[acyl-carrier-protein] synthase II
MEELLGHFGGGQPERADASVARPMREAQSENLDRLVALCSTRRSAPRRAACRSARRKSMVGRLIGAAGALSAMVCARAMRDGMVPPTINLRTPDPGCDLDYVPLAARRTEVRTAIANAFGLTSRS